MLNLNSILVFSENPAALAAFYEKVFQIEPGFKDSDYSGFQAGSVNFMVGPHDKVKGKNQNPERIMINFETEDVQSEFDRIKELGAEVVAEPYNPMGEEDKSNALIATFADPDGNYFQLATPWKTDES